MRAPVPLPAIILALTFAAILFLFDRCSAHGSPHTPCAESLASGPAEPPHTACADHDPIHDPIYTPLPWWDHAYDEEDAEPPGCSPAAVTSDALLIFSLHVLQGLLTATGLIVWADAGQTWWRRRRARRALIRHLGRP